ncbi:hypothetical protein TSAR_009529 [Trichomalopsis sarcophagae]|uniref:Uncharacterized protein n=1 Tax=Trichomalopsis sarcophagae TaxID=543379 RepID=A0A232EKU9_9HYME|nr:hypothetical protein TSAR_009529 [Trichomalopsis sarcophagae]
MHPTYSPSYYHLFQSMQNVLNGVKLDLKGACENHLVKFFAQEHQKFYSDGCARVVTKGYRSERGLIFRHDSGDTSICLAAIAMPEPE